MRLAFALIVIVGAATFWNSVHGPFIFDDIGSIPDNPTIRSLWPLTGPLSPPSRSESVAGRPLVNLSLAVNYAVGGLEVGGYHVVNIGLHVACALLLFGIVRRTLVCPLLRDRFGEHANGLSLACALLWMVHPLQSEPVDYIVARTESLMALFFLLTLYSSIRANPANPVNTSTAWSAAAVLSCAAGMTCKETMAVAPLAVMFYGWTFSREAFGRRRLFYFALMATWAIAAAAVWSGPRSHSVGFNTGEGGGGGSGAWTYLLNQSVMIARYLRLLIWPQGLVLDYGYPQALTLSQVWPQALLIIALIALVVFAMRRWPACGFAGAWCFLALAPSSSVVPIVTEVGAERRIYLASMSLVALAVVAAWSGIRRLLGDATRAARLSCGVTVVACAALAAATVARNREYRSPLTMWQTVVDRWPNGRAYSNLATELQAAGRTSEVIPALRLAVRDFPDAEYDLGSELFASGQFSEAIGHLDAFIRARPQHFKAPGAKTLTMRAWTNLGIAHASNGQVNEAVDAFERALAFDPGSADLQRNLANALLDRKDFAGAERHAREALRLRPDDAVAREIMDLARAPHPTGR